MGLPVSLDTALFLCLCVFGISRDSLIVRITVGGVGDWPLMSHPSSLSLIVGATVFLGRAGTAIWTLGLDSFLLDNFISFLISPSRGEKKKKKQEEGQAGPRDTWVLRSIHRLICSFQGRSMGK